MTIDYFASPPKKPPGSAGAPDADWKSRLTYNDKGAIASGIANIRICLEHHPEWLHALAFDEFSATIIVTDFAPAEIERGILKDHVVTQIRCWIEHEFLERAAPPEQVYSAIDSVARTRSFHPVRNYLDSLKWDGVARLDRFFQVYFHAQGSADYLREVARMFFVAAVARIYQPGCQADHLLVLEGKQGIYKSRGLQTLFGDSYFTDQMPALDSRDASLQLRGKWCIEFAEFDRLSRSETSTVKAYVTRRIDVCRPPYGRQTIEILRQCIFTATTNNKEYLTDKQNRRFWPVCCQQASIEAIAQDRDQLWAEAVNYYRTGTRWWPSTDLVSSFESEQEAREIENPYLGKISAFLNQEKSRMQMELDPNWLTITRIFEDWKIPESQWPSMRQHLAKALRKLGYRHLLFGRERLSCWIHED